MNGAEGLVNWVSLGLSNNQKQQWRQAEVVRSFGWDVEAMVSSYIVILELTGWCRHCCSWQYMPLDSLKAIPAPTLACSLLLIGNHSAAHGVSSKLAVNGCMQSNLGAFNQGCGSQSLGSLELIFNATSFVSFVAVVCSRRVDWFQQPVDQNTKPTVVRMRHWVTIINWKLCDSQSI
jgi:hypothetical protein